MKKLSSKTWNEVTTGTAVVDFWSSGCGPCLRMAPALDGLSLEYEDQKITFGKLNVEDDETGIFTSFGVNAVPTLVILKDGKEISRKVGLQSEAELRKWIDSNK